jgi:hypothetical protein
MSHGIQRKYPLSARPVHSTAQNPFQDVIAQRELCCQDGATHGVVEVGVAKGRPPAALHEGGVEGQHGQAKTVPDASLDLSALELKSLRERESDQPSQSRTAGAAKKAGTRFFRVRAGVVGVQQSVCTDLGRVPGYHALRVGNGAHAAGADLADFWSPQRTRDAMQGLPLRTQHIASGAVKWPEGFRVAVHGAVCGGSRCEVCGDSGDGAGVGQAQTAMAMGEGDLFVPRSVLMGPHGAGKQAIHSLTLRLLNKVSHMLPWTASRQGCHAPLEAAVGQNRAVLVGQRQGLQLLHQLAGEVGACTRASRLEDWGADRGPRCKETFGGLLQFKMVGYGSGGGYVL